ncbi:MAG TPA: ATP-binding protein [Bacteriovoracaceae bacterium]|nr:ATP-binding protein [Bacteriovoracaceae bacterium]
MNKYFRIFTLILLLFTAIVFTVKWYYKIQLQSKIETLIQVNQSMMHYQGMTYDLTGLGPLIGFNIEESEKFELIYLRLSSEKNIYDRTFHNNSTNFLNKVSISMYSKDIIVFATVRLTAKSSSWIFIYSLCVLIVLIILILLLKLSIASRKSKELSDLATQVAHDIRSPLEVLKGLKKEVETLPEDSQRQLLMSIRRIEEISHNLLQYNKLSIFKREIGFTDTEELLSLIESIVMEKRLEYSSSNNVEILCLFDVQSCGLFSNVPRITLKRVISNLINNGVEALNKRSGKISVSLKSDGEWNLIEISDTGVGIPQDIMKNIFERGFTTKEKGNGLGLSNAFKEIKTMGGSLAVDSKLKFGTIVKIRLPKSPAPSFVVNRINAFKYNNIIILDDDQSIHSIWKMKFKTVPVNVECFYTFESLKETYTQLPPKTLLLSDLELANDEIDGFKAISYYNQKNDSILITARSEEIEVRQKCIKEGIKLLPKNVINYIGLTLNIPIIVLIDDDKFIQLNWANHFKKINVLFKGYYSVEEFLNNSNSIGFDSLIYIDSNLGNGIKGEVASREIFIRGFHKLFLATSYRKQDIDKPFWIEEIYSKNPFDIEVS